MKIVNDSKSWLFVSFTFDNVRERLDRDTAGNAEIPPGGDLALELLPGEHARLYMGWVDHAAEIASLERSMENNIKRLTELRARQRGGECKTG